MPEWSEIFSQARDLNPTVNLDDETQRNSVFEALKKGWPALHQGLINLGFGAAQSRFQKDLDAANTARTNAETALATLRDQVKQKQDPEVKQLNEQWQTKLTEETTKLQTELQQEKARVRGILLERDQEHLRNLLVERNVPKANARGIAYDPKLLPERSEYDEKGSLTVYQAGQKIPLMPGNGQTVLHAVADELVATPEVQEILISNGDAGGGITGGRSSGPATGDRAFFEGIKKTAEDDRKGATPAKPLRERIKNR